jgi:stringent starvation protein B
MSKPPANGESQGSSTRPYLIRALHDWCTDNGFTPYIAVFVDDAVRVPKEYVKNNEIVLNVGFEATSALKLGNELIEFKARFGGTSREIAVPIDHVIAIYARENGQGMAFPMPSEGQTPAADAAENPAVVTPPRGGPKLTLTDASGATLLTYAAAKGGLLGLTNVIAIEGAQHGILANTVLPFGYTRMVTGTVPDPKFLEESGFLKAIQPDLAVPIVVFLASRACELSHHNYSAGAGRFARVFVGLGEGWLAAPGSKPTADDVAAHLTDVSATEPFSVPMSIFDEVFGICDRLGVTP